MVSKEDLLKQAKSKQYKPEILEKVLKLLEVLRQFMAVPYLRERFVLKGGTALNLFQFENLPRLSVDIDLNYIGTVERAKMLQERPVINEAVYKILKQLGFEPERQPTNYAGGKMIWRYSSVLGQKGNLEIDLNYMYRQPLLNIEWKSPKLLTGKSFDVSILDIHELAAGKLSALFSRRTSRDLFDAHYLLTKCDLNKDKLRQIFVIYIAMTEVNVNHIVPEVIDYDLIDIRNQLFPLMLQLNLPLSEKALKSWADKTTNELQRALLPLLNLSNEQKEFIRRVREKGEIKAELISNDHELVGKVKSHPAILWAIQKSN